MQSRIRVTSKATGHTLILDSRITTVEVERTYNNMTQTAKVVLPRHLQLVDPEQPNYKIRVGDSISIELGYESMGFNKEFEGYVTLIKPDTQIELMCEDEMWLQKQITVNKAWKSITMKELVTYLVPGTDTTLVPDVTFTPFRIENSTVAKALEKLKEYGVVIYYRNKKLYVGFPYYDTNVKQVNYLFDKPGSDGNAKKEGLEFRRPEDYKIKLQAISILPDNTQLKVEVGDSDGDLRTFHYPNIRTEAELKQIAEVELKKKKSDGLTGTFKTIGGFPYADHGFTCSLYSDSRKELNGYYFIEKVKVTYDKGGYKRILTPSSRSFSL